MEIIEGKVENEIVSDSGGIIIKEWHIGYKTLKEIFEKYEDEEIQVIIQRKTR